ncbi:response regulator transcription factor [Spirosoma sp.]|uniref:response regulator n=1 Tax=Spirosoma sp. TaxID=1899569 RepID=UPI00260C2AE9|nr:response regulator transcription factor [Spirosoma sp.]MCX6217446.1 response regulator transcription factor [Spirosoma sp.]
MKNRYKILHVDDDLYMRKIVQLTLNNEFKLDSCTNGIEAMNWLESGNIPDIIITDLLMPQLSGQELIQLLRKNATYKNIPIIVLSSLEDGVTKTSCIQQGADDFISKPFNPREIHVKVKSILHQAIERQESPANYDPTYLS